jgi:hypothetical protein
MVGVENVVRRDAEDPGRLREVVIAHQDRAHDAVGVGDVGAGETVDVPVTGSI